MCSSHWGTTESKSVLCPTILGLTLYPLWHQLTSLLPRRLQSHQSQCGSSDGCVAGEARIINVTAESYRLLRCIGVRLPRGVFLSCSVMPMAVANKLSLAQFQVPDRSADALTTIAAVSQCFLSKMNRKHCFHRCWIWCGHSLRVGGTNMRK